MATSNPSIVGRTITGIRRLNDEECEQIWGMPASMYDNWLLSWMMAVNSFHLQILKAMVLGHCSTSTQKERAKHLFLHKTDNRIQSDEGRLDTYPQVLTA